MGSVEAPGTLWGQLVRRGGMLSPGSVGWFSWSPFREGREMKTRHRTVWSPGPVCRGPRGAGEQGGVPELHGGLAVGRAQTQAGSGLPMGRACSLLNGVNLGRCLISMTNH